MKHAPLGAFLLFVTSSLLNNVYAGGGLISLSSNSYSPIDGSQQNYLVTATVQKADNSTCQYCPVQFFVEDLHPSKYIISPSSDKTDSNGQVSAKFSLTSNSSANMVIYAQAQIPETYKSSQYILSFQQTPDTIVMPQPAIRPITITTFPLTIDANHPVEGLKDQARLVFVNWSPVDGADYYDVKLRPTDYSNWAIPQGSPTKNSPIQLILSSDTDYYIQVDACNSSTCVSSLQTLVGKSTNNPSEIKPLLGDKKIEELQSKIASLEDKVAQTQKKQGFLESQINNIVKFLKSIFPFWK